MSRIHMDVGRTEEELECLRVLLEKISAERHLPPEGTLRIHYAGPKNSGVFILTFSVGKRQVWGENGTRDQLVERFSAWLSKHP